MAKPPPPPKGKKGAGGNPFAKGRVPTTKGPPANDPLAMGGAGSAPPPMPMGPPMAKGGKVPAFMKSKHAAWEKSPAGKKDAAFDKKMGIKEDSPRDMKIDRAKMARGR
jgi:hypothetical protein